MTYTTTVADQVMKFCPGCNRIQYVWKGQLLSTCLETKIVFVNIRWTNGLCQTWIPGKIDAVFAEKLGCAKTSELLTEVAARSREEATVMLQD